MTHQEKKRLTESPKCSETMAPSGNAKTAKVSKVCSCEARKMICIVEDVCGKGRRKYAK